MDYITSFDIRLENDVYYAGELVRGNVLIENVENIKIKGLLFPKKKKREHIYLSYN